MPDFSVCLLWDQTTTSAYYVKVDKRGAIFFYPHEPASPSSGLVDKKECYLSQAPGGRKKGKKEKLHIADKVLCRLGMRHASGQDLDRADGPRIHFSRGGFQSTPGQALPGNADNDKNQTVPAVRAGARTGCWL